jgi:hypothetical protein
MKPIFLFVGCVFMPFFYIGFILGGVYTPLLDLYKSIYAHYKSSEPFGHFDRS